MTPQELIAKIREKGVVDNTMDPRYFDKVMQMAKKGLHVYHVNDATFILGGVDEAHMVSYCFVSKDDTTKQGEKDFWWNFNDGYAFANVVNDSWDIEEMGTIGFTLRNGMMKRTA